MQADAFRRIHPYTFFNKFLAQQVRPDGRTLHKARNTIITTNTLHTAQGSAMVKLGNTNIVCGIKAEVTRPHDQEPKLGFCFPSVEITSLSLENSEWTRRDEMSVPIASLLSRLLQMCVNREALCIVPGEAVWVLYVDVYVLEHDGNVQDAALLAAFTALTELTLPQVNYDEEKGEVTLKLSEQDNETVETVKISNLLHFYPIPLSFGLFVATGDNDEQQDDSQQQQEYILADPTGEEEALVSTHITIVYNSETLELCQVSVVPNHSVDSLQGHDTITRTISNRRVKDDQLKQCMSLAKSRVPLIVNMIKKAVSK